MRSLVFVVLGLALLSPARGWSQTQDIISLELGGVPPTPIKAIRGILD